MISAFKAFMDATISIKPSTGFDAWGKPTYGTPFNLKCRIEPKIELVPGKDGNEQLSTGFIIADHNAQIDPDSLITLPAGYVPQEVSIINVFPVTGPNGTFHHLEIRI